jgi:hypothetical protein
LTGSTDPREHRVLHRRLPLLIGLLLAAIVVALLISRIAA